MDAKFRLEKI